jgi:hypothetical protein
MQTLEEMNAHYKAVRARLNAGPPPKPLFIAPPEPEPEPEPEPIPEPVVVVIVPPKEPVLLTPVQQILKEVAEKHGVTVKDIKGKCRKLKCIRPRHEAAYRIRMEQGFSLPQIGRVLGFRDHTTILHGIRRYAKKLEAH